tara:strand:- start:342 stop:509 length:168 start_codon:yes stop_codon:yes gene_type:complete
MPLPFHCHECDAPTMNEDGICDDCAKRKKNMVFSNNTGEPMKWLDDEIEEEDEDE